MPEIGTSGPDDRAGQSSQLTPENNMQQADTHLVIRNPFGTMDVPEPGDSEVMDYAATATLAGDAADDNAAQWASFPVPDPLDGTWASRWNGGADPTIAGDT